jgi:hypothetical protein
MNFILILYSHGTNESREIKPPTSSSQLVSVLISFIYYGFGFLVTYRYYQTGLLVVCINQVLLVNNNFLFFSLYGLGLYLFF